MKRYMAELIQASKQDPTEKLLSLISQYSEKQKQFFLFLDIDGTLSEFHPDPTKSFIPKNTLKILEELKKLNVQVIPVTGRSVKIAAQLFSPLHFSIAGTHGLEIKINQQYIATGVESINYSLIRKNIKTACSPYPELLLENKDYSIAIHYRQYPELEKTAFQIAHNIQALHPELKINTGKYVVELLPHGADKGQAIQKILQYYNAPQAFTMFIGDDQTDESGFKVINQSQGISIKVGPEQTLAGYRLKDVKAVANFLDLFSKALAKTLLRASQTSKGENKCLN